MARQVNGRSPADVVRFSSRAEEEAQAIALSERLGLPYVDVAAFRIDADLFRAMPVEWMLRYNFVPESRTDRAMTTARRSRFGGSAIYAMSSARCSQC